MSPSPSTGEVNVTVIATALHSEELCGTEVPMVPAHGHMDTETKLLMVQVSIEVLVPPSWREQSRASPHPSARLDGAYGCCRVHQVRPHLVGPSPTISGMVPSLPCWGEVGTLEAAGCVMFSSHRAWGCSKDSPGGPKLSWAIRADGLLVGFQAGKKLLEAERHFWDREGQAG